MSDGQSPVLAIGRPRRRCSHGSLLPMEFNEALSPVWAADRLDVALFDAEGNPVLGREASDAIILGPGETRLPFVLRVSYRPGWHDNGQSSWRRGLFVTGLASTLVLMVAAAYGLWRATAKEMALARQQSDFMAAVSHEFRTPLTSMRHLTELLATNSVPDESRKATYYRLLARETARLHRMVEGLLNASRMQAGAYAWRRNPCGWTNWREPSSNIFAASRTWRAARSPTTSLRISPSSTPTLMRWSAPSPISCTTRRSIRLPRRRSGSR